MTLADPTRQHGDPTSQPPTGTVLDGIRGKVFLDRYARKGEDGKALEAHPEQMWRRVAEGIAAAERTPEARATWTERFADLLHDFKFVPGGRILSGAGTGHQVTYYNCYVVGLGENPLDPAAPKRPVLDPAAARPAFFNALSAMTDIMSRSGGVGMNLSALPPRGTAIASPGRTGHAAVRPTVALSLEHPDVSRLLDEKDGPHLTSVDIAVIVPSAFDEALKADGPWTPRWGEQAGETTQARDLWARVTSDEGRPVMILRPETEMLRIEDSRIAIVDGAAAAAAHLYNGEAVVVDFSLLRPKGAYIKTVNGTSSGPVAWMYLLDAVACADDGASPAEKGVIWFGEIASTITGKTIQQGGSRRGALMLMLDDDHPDVEEFIRAKRIGPDGRPVMLEHANLSLCVSDRFMDAVKADLPWDLVWQGQVVRTVRARTVWDQICTAAWTTAEPGVVFMERYQERSNTWYFENIRCVNPCVTGDTEVLTDKGPRTIADLARLVEQGESVRVISPTEDGADVHQIEAVFATGVKPVFLLQTVEKHSIRLTADHRVLTDRGWVEARDLTPEHRIHSFDAVHGSGLLQLASLTPDGEEMVYDLTEPNAHLFVANGLVVHNCGEQGLPPGGVCNLGALNLERYVVDGVLQEEALAHDAAVATRFLDDVIDATPYFSDLHVKMQRDGTRRTGLGTMGLADALIKLEVAYGSPASLVVIDRIYAIIRDAAYRASVALAREKEPFGFFDAERYGQGHFIKRLPADIQTGIKEHGIRNGVLLTQAPTGCLIPGTMTPTSHGYLPIETLGDAAGEQWQDIALDVASEGGMRRADHFFINGEAHTTRVVTRRGYAIQGTDHHRIRIWRDGVLEWIPLDQVTPGMIVPIQAPGFIGEARAVLLEQPERCQVHGTQVSLPHSLSASLAYLVGYFMGDGSLKTRTLRFASSNKADAEQICTFLRDLFGHDPLVYADPRAKDLTSIELHGQDVVAFWRANDFAKRAPSALHSGKGYTPHIPLAILRSNDEAVYGGFLAGLFDADASLDREYVISWNTNEQTFHDQVKTMLLALGVFTHTYQVVSEWSKAPLYRLRPCHAHAAALLNRALPLLTRIVPQESDARRLTLGDTVPVTPTQGRDLALVGQTGRDKQAAYAATHLGYMTREKMTRLVASYHDTLDAGSTVLLVDAIDEPLFFDRVAAVEDGGIQPTFDLSVPGTHAYIANGFISHNTTSLLANVSSGIEPVYDFAMQRVDRTGTHIMYHPLYEAWRDAHPGEDRPDFFVGAKDLSPEEHVVVQAKVQEYTDSSISKTSNAPNDHTVDEVKRLYMQAYDLGCKGVTYYRDGSRDAVLTSVVETPKVAVSTPTAESEIEPVALATAADDGADAPGVQEAVAEAPFPVEQSVAAPLAHPVPASLPEADPMPAWVLEGRLKRRPSEMGGFTRNVAAPEGKVNITINADPDGPLELFINVGRAGSDIAALAEALGRLISLQLRFPSTMSQEERLRQAANQLRGIGGSRSIGFGKDRVLSLPDAVAQAIYRHLEEHPTPPAPRTAGAPSAQLALPVGDGSGPSTSLEPAAAASSASVVGGAVLPTASPAPGTSVQTAGQDIVATAAVTLPGLDGATVNARAQIDGASAVKRETNGHGNGNGHGQAQASVLARASTLTGNLCPQCGSSGAYVFEEGCKKCHYCGYSEC